MNLSDMTEEELREYKVPYIKTQEELDEIIKQVTERQHTYGTCVYAMSIAATAAFNFVAGQLGVTGFQSSCADLDILRRTRLYDGPFMVVDLSNYLYPQYDLPARVQEAIDDNAEWFKNKAKENLENRSGACDSVIAHWEKLANA